MIYVITGIYFVFFGSLVYRYDLFEQEPWYALAFVAVLCAVMTYGFTFFADFAIEQLAWLGDERLVGALIAGFGEELLKLVATLLTLFVFHKHFNDPFDGLVYGAFAGLGFAAYETWLYNSFDGVSTLQDRAMHGFVRFLIHCLLGALTCAGVGFAKFKTPNWRLAFITLTFASMMLHYSYDYVVLGMSSGNSDRMPQQRVVLVLIMSCLLVLFGRTVVIGSRKSGTVHGRNARRLYAWPVSLLVRRANTKPNQQGLD